MLRPAHRLFTNNSYVKNVSYLCYCQTASYSKRSGSESPDIYKIVKAGKTVDDIDDSLMGSSPNWELLNPRGYRFYLPGSVGPAWHDQTSTSQIDEFSDLKSPEESSNVTNVGTVSTLECIAQECPLLLRRGVLEMFPGMAETGGSQLTVVTLTQKSEKNLSRDVTELERERLAKCFVLAAQEICTKLKLAGYWADFINPFSGLPYLHPSISNRLFETDQRFRCLGFEITDRNDCKVIGRQRKIANSFVGSLFTTAPANTKLIKDILYQYE